MDTSLPPSLLTPTRMRILWALLKYPEASDREIADLIKSRPSTVYTVKKTLLYHQVFDEIYIPSFNFLGIEFISVHLFPPSNYSNQKEIRELQKIVEALPQSVYSIRIGGHTSIISLHRDYSQFTKYRILLKEAVINSGTWSFTTIKEMLFPLKSSDLMAYFTFYRALEGFTRSLPEGESFKRRDRCILRIEELSWNDCMVLMGILRFPALRDSHISSLLKISRQKVARVRNSLMEGGALRKKRVLNLWRFPLEVIIMAGGGHHPKPETDYEKESMFLTTLKSLPLFFAVSTPFSTFLLGSMNSTEKMDRTRDTFVSLWNSLYTDNSGLSLITTPPDEIVVFRNLDYFPLVEEVTREIFFR